MIAFALATRARLLILDEPTNGLNIPSKSTFRKVIAASLDEKQCILISTHQVRDLESLIDSFMVLDKGRIIFNHTVDEIAAKLVFKHAKQLDGHPSIYSEPSFGGYNIVSPNSDNESSRIEMETLFKAVIAQPDLLQF